MTIHRRTRDAARGQWKGILQELGVPGEHLQGRHAPCPLCGGKDRFRFDNKGGRGTWICNRCGAGDGIALAQRILQFPFAETAKRLDAILAIGPRQADQKGTELGDDHRLCALRTVARQTFKVQKGDLVDRYLTARGVGEDLSYAPVLRFAPRLLDGEGGVRPAMVATVQAPDGSNHTLHRTFLRPDGLAKAEMSSPRKFMPGAVAAGSAVRLSAWAAGPLGVAEGIETALAARRLFGMPVWAALTAGGLEKWVAPPSCTEVHIFGDNDSNFRGQQATYELAKQLAAAGVNPSVHIPSNTGDDWLDVWVRECDN